MSLALLGVIAFGGWLFFTFGPSYLMGDYLTLVEWVWCALVAAFAVMILVDPLRLSIRGGYFADLLIIAAWGGLIFYFFKFGGPIEIFGSWVDYWFWGLMAVIAVSALVTLVRWLVYEVHRVKRKAATAVAPKEGEEPDKLALNAQAPSGDDGESAAGPAEGDSADSPSSQGDSGIERAAQADAQNNGDAAASLAATAQLPRAEAVIAPLPASRWHEWDRRVAEAQADLTRQEQTAPAAVISMEAVVRAFNGVQLQRYLAGTFMEGGWSVASLPADAIGLSAPAFSARKGETNSVVACYGSDAGPGLDDMALLDALASHEGYNGVVVVSTGVVAQEVAAFARDEHFTLWQAGDLVDFI